MDESPQPPLLGHALGSSDYDYCLPVPMTEFQRQLNDEIVSLYRPDILKFFENNEAAGDVDRLVSPLEAFFTTSQLVGTHPFLLVDHYLPPNMLLKEIPSHISKSSGKFAALTTLTELLRNKKLEIALIARPGKSFDLIEVLLLGKMINYKRHSGSYLRASQKSNSNYSTIHLIPSSLLDSTYVGNDRFDLVIAFDQTFNKDDAHIKVIRSQGRISPHDLDGSTPKLAPIIRLIPYYSAEHIALKLQKLALDSSTYIQRVVAALVVLSDRVGILPGDIKSHYVDGLKYLLPWISDMRQEWPLASLPDIEAYSLKDAREFLTAGAVNSNFDDTTRLENGETENYETKPEDYAGPRAKRIKRENFSPNSIEASTSFMSPPLEDLHSQFARQHALAQNILKRLEDTLQDAKGKESEILSLRSEASTKQTMHENAVEEMRDLVNQITQLTEKIRISERKAERQDSEAKRLQEQVEIQATELEQVNKLLVAKKRQDTDTMDNKESDGKEISFPGREAQLAQIAGLEKDLDSAHTFTDKKTAENDSMRAEYQKESSAAIESAEEVAKLKAQNATYTAKLASDIVTLKSLQFEAERKIKKAHATELAYKLANVEQYLKRLLENEKHTPIPTRARYGKRSSSTAPRRTNSPSVNSRRSSPSDREGASTNGNGHGNGGNGPHPLQNMTNSL